MKKEFLGYWDSLWRDIPIYIWEAEVYVLILGIVVLLLWKGRKSGFRMSFGLLLVAYVVIIYCSTVIFRVTGSETGHDFMPFWSYRAILVGRDDLIVENLMNTLVFVPVGILIGTQMSQKAQKGWQVAIGVGFLISVLIETLQYFLHRGFSEVDDVIHNTIGCILGYILVKGLRIMVRGRARR